MPDAAPFMPSIPPGPGMCCARLRGAFPAPVSPTETQIQKQSVKRRGGKNVTNEVTAQQKQTNSLLGEQHTESRCHF